MIVAARDSAALAEALGTMMDKPQSDLEKMGRTAHEKSRDLTLDRYRDQVAAWIRTLLDGSKTDLVR